MNALAPTSTGLSHDLARDLVTGMEWPAATVRDLLSLAADVKSRPENYRTALAGKYLALIFEKPSLRTRTTFDVGMQGMGGGAVFLDHTATRLGERESVQDVAKNLERWVHAIAARTYSQCALEELAAHATIPIINALSDRYHPCQAFADFFTLEEHFGGVRGLKMAYVGDGNNVCHSLLLAGARLGAQVRVATPAGYEPSADIVAEAKRAARDTRAKIELFHSAQEAVAGSQAVYTDVWASMGQENETEARAKIFAPFQVNKALMKLAAPDAVFLHCLPAHRGSEVSAEVMDSPRSIAYDQAENRLHIQKAILLLLLS
ncbi:MAG TPA: ornithine carbamoyltransferase [Candidatus Acidoferrales bacterium]|nr:ornithine carbamoyltransferase [Candidatus Acidoferrales bacterium]